MEEKEFELKRRNLVMHLKSSGAVKSALIEEAFAKVKREFFLPLNQKPYAYADQAMPIGFNQTISQPSTIAVMLELLELKKGLKVLEIGSGSGYVCALLKEIVGEGKVFGMEMVKELAEQSLANLKNAGIEGVEIVQGDGSVGYMEEAPFERILVSAACGFIPKPLFEQLVEGGLIVAPVGDKYTQEMQILHKINGKPVKEKYLHNYFVFVPLKGKQGWK